MRILLTGATGFIGSHLTRALVRAGHEVFALVRPDADLWRLQDVVPSLRLVRGDLGSLESLRPVLSEIRPAACCHLAWCPAIPGTYLMARENLEMLEAALRLARYLTDAGCEVLLGTGTCLEYDTDAGRLSEAAPTVPRSLYAATKLACGLALEHWGEVTGLRVVWARLFQEFGPHEDERRLVPLVARALLTNQRFRPRTGSQVRDYLPVEDVAEALRLLLESDVRGPVNVGSGMPVSVLDLARSIGRLIGRDHLVDAPTPADEGPGPAVICADSGLLQARTPWRPPSALEPGLLRAIAWWEQRLGTAVPDRV